MAKKTPRRLSKAQDEEGKLQFHGFRLLQSGSRLGELKPNELPGHASQKINVGIGLDEAAKTVGVNVKIRLDATYDGVETKESPISIFASFLITFSIAEPFSNRHHLDEFVEHVGMRTVWPYWREFVQSMTVRMGLPPFPVPVIYVGKLIKDKSLKTKTD